MLTVAAFGVGVAAPQSSQVQRVAYTVNTVALSPPLVPEKNKLLQSVCEPDAG